MRVSRRRRPWIGTCIASAGLWAAVWTRLTGNWTGKLEYLHMGFGSVRSTPPTAANTAVAFDANTRVTSDGVRIGVNYKFGGSIIVE